ncbi:MAG: hypothetical protein RL217_1865 [Pseudomonadota bacterium]|jgi:hypothetical protein
MKKIFVTSAMKKLPLAVAVTGMFGFAGAHAVEFNFGELSAQIDNNVSYGVAWRTEKPDAGQVMPGNATAMGFTGKGPSYNYDDGTLNYKQWDVYTNNVKWNGDLEVKYANYGVFARARAWYDQAIMDETPRFKEFNSATKSYAGAGAELLDAFVWADYDLVGMPINLRVGRQVVNWGESTFIQGGINSINPVDASAFRRPGAEIKEGMLPVNMVYASVGLTSGTTLEAFYQLQWEKTRTDPCGTFFSTVDFVADGCGPVVLGGTADERDMLEFRDQEIATGVPLSQRVSPMTERIDDAEPRDDGQFGVALRTYTELFGGTEFGLYYMNIHSRQPYINGVLTNQDRLGVLSNGVGSTASINPTATYDTYRPLYQIAYPEDIQIMGASYSLSLPNGASLGGELSYRPDMPLQWNAFELILAGNGVPWSRMYQQKVTEAGTGNASSVYGEIAEGSDKFDMWQFQTTYIQFFDRVLGGDQLALAAEVGVTHVAGLPSLDKARYGRSGAYGIGNNGGVGNFLPAGVSAGTDMCSFGTPATNSARNENDSYCTDEGYVTDWSGGIRLRAGLTFNNAFAGVNMTPNINLGYDLGYGPEPGAQFIDKRLSYGVGASFVYLNNTTVDVTYAGFDGGDYDQMIDRDNVSLAVKYAF